VMCEFIFHLKDDADEASWGRHKRRRRWRCRCDASGARN
jgi:hypothetical protein